MGQKQNAFVLLIVCLARQWDMPTTLHRKDSIKKQYSKKNSDFYARHASSLEFKG